MKRIALGAVFALGLSVVLLGGWRFARWMNWETSYKSGTEKAIKRMVKPECLKSPEAPDG